MGGTFTSEPTTVNGNPGLVLRVDRALDGVLAEELTRVESETPLTSR